MRISFKKVSFRVLLALGIYFLSANGEAGEVNVRIPRDEPFVGFSNSGNINGFRRVLYFVRGKMFDFNWGKIESASRESNFNFITHCTLVMGSPLNVLNPDNLIFTPASEVKLNFRTASVKYASHGLHSVSYVGRPQWIKGHFTDFGNTTTPETLEFQSTMNCVQGFFDDQPLNLKEVLGRYLTN